MLKETQAIHPPEELHVVSVDEVPRVQAAEASQEPPAECIMMIDHAARYWLADLEPFGEPEMGTPAGSGRPATENP